MAAQMAALEQLQQLLPKLKAYSIILFTVKILNLLGSLFVLVACFRRWLIKQESFTIDYRFPMYMALTDIGLFATFMANQYGISPFLHPITPQNPFFIPKVLSSPGCEIVAYLIYVLIIINSSLVVIMTITTYFSVYRKKSIFLGRYDWRLFFWAILYGGVFGAAGFPSIGKSDFWCFIKPRSLFLPVDATIWLGTSLVMCYVCFFRIISLFQAHNRYQVTLNGSDIQLKVRLSRTQRRLCRTVLVYTVILTVQWLPAIGTILWPIYFGIQSLDLFFVTDLFVNIGGLANAIQFVWVDGVHSSFPSLFEEGGKTRIFKRNKTPRSNRSETPASRQSDFSDMSSSYLGTMSHGTGLWRADDKSPRSTAMEAVHPIRPRDMEAMQYPDPTTKESHYRRPSEMSLGNRQLSTAGTYSSWSTDTAMPNFHVNGHAYENSQPESLVEMLQSTAPPKSRRPSIPLDSGNKVASDLHTITTVGNGVSQTLRARTPEYNQRTPIATSLTKPSVFAEQSFAVPVTAGIPTTQRGHERTYSEMSFSKPKLSAEPTEQARTYTLPSTQVPCTPPSTQVPTATPPSMPSPAQTPEDRSGSSKSHRSFRFSQKPLRLDELRSKTRTPSPAPGFISRSMLSRPAVGVGSQGGRNARITDSVSSFSSFHSAQGSASTAWLPLNPHADDDRL